MWRAGVRVARLALAGCGAAFIFTSPAAAQSDAGTPAGAASAAGPVLIREADGGVTVRATRISEAIAIDGRLEESSYRDVPAITDFIQQVPDEGAPVSERTEVWVMFDRDQIYLACRCRDTDPSRIVGNDMRRDSSNLPRHDNFAVTFDTFLDRRNAFFFLVTAAGGMYDTLVTDERSNAEWRGVWESRVRRSDEGYVVEIAIPFKTLRYDPGRQQTWGVQIRRAMYGKNERAHLTAVDPVWGMSGIRRMESGATLVGLEVPPARANVEVKPYALSRVVTDRLSRPIVDNDLERAAGLDVKYGVTSGLTADFTYNTDFAQVEIDEAQINLTRFSLLFPEKREFFLEGQGVFEFGSGGGNSFGGGGDLAPNVFYSRQIGLSEGRAIPLIGGGRLTGKAGAWSVGALNVETGEDSAAAARRTNFTVLRLQRDIMARSKVGAIVTRRSVSTTAPGANLVWGLDGNLAFQRLQSLYISGYITQSRTEGRRGDDLAYRAQFVHNADRYGLTVDRLVVEPRFNPEVGFLRRQDFRRNFIQGRFSPRTVKRRWVRQWIYRADLEYVTDNDDRLESRDLTGHFGIEFHNTDTLSVQYSRLHEFLAEPFRIARGVLIPVGGHSFGNAVVSYGAGPQRRVSGNTTLEAGRFYTGTKKTASFRGRIEATARLGIEPTLSLNWIDLPEGSFTTTIVGGRTIYTMTPRMFVAALVQYSSSSASVAANLRLRWEYRPGSELFVVYTEGRSTFPPRGTDLQNRGLAIKINRLFQF